MYVLLLQTEGKTSLALLKLNDKSPLHIIYYIINLNTLRFYQA